MGTITTKYSVGDKVYIIDTRGIMNEYVRVELEDVRGISFDGRRPTYEFRTQKRYEVDIYDDLAMAKEVAKKKAKERYERNVELIDGDSYGKPQVSS